MAPLTEIKQYVHQHIFEHIFNYACNSLRNNVACVTMNSGRPIRGSIYNNVIQAELPDRNNFYYLYLCSGDALSNLLRDVEDWALLADVANDHGIRLDVYSDDMRMLSKSVCYIKAVSEHQIAVLVPQKVFARYSIPHSSKMYITISDDTDGVDDRAVISHSPEVSIRWDDILNAVGDPANAGKCTVYVNGWDYDPSRIGQVVDPTKDFVDLVIDHNVVLAFTQSLENRKTYYSSEEALYKDLIIMDDLNVDDKVFTYDTFDIAVRDIDTGKGLSFHYIADQSVSQLTHDIISVSSYIIDDIFDLLVGDHYELVIKVSDFNKGNVHWANGNFTQRLYLESAEFVQAALLDGLYPKVPVWTADRLESSAYSKYLTRLVDIAEGLEDTLKSQIQCLGYHEFINLIGRHHGSIEVTDNPLSTFIIDKPIYWDDFDLEVMVFSNGLKVRDDRYSLTMDDGRFLGVSFLPDLDLPTEPDVQYVLIEKPKPFTYTITPSAVNRSLAIPNTGISFRSYRKVSSAYHDHLGLLGNDAYNEINSAGNLYFSVVTDEHFHTLYFSTTSYDEDFVIALEDGSNVQLLYNRNVNDGSALSFPLITESISGENVPILVDGEYETYLNGHYLTRSIDYEIFPIIDGDGFTKGNTLVIQNKRWLQESNDVEIYKTNTFSRTSEVGYVVDRRIPCSDSNEVWIDGLSRLYVDGKLIPHSKISRNKDHYLLDPGVSTNGNVYHMKVAINSSIHREFLPYEDTQYQADRNAITAYYGNLYDYENTQPIVVPSVHKVYSVYLTEVIKRIVSGSMVVEYINDDQAILDQLLTLDWLRQYDLILSTNKINKDYVDLYPIALDNVEVNTLDQYLFINRLVSILIGDDHVNDGNVLFVQP